MKPDLQTIMLRDGAHKKGIVFVDELFTAEARGAQAHRVGARNGHRWCHMFSQDVDELHRIARLIGMKRAWFQDRQGFPHYDLTPAKRALAIREGAIATTLREWLQFRGTDQNEAARLVATQPELFKSGKIN